MKKKMILLVSLLLLPLLAQAENRLALVIGNSAYVDLPLTNPIHDATDMAAMLRSLNFTVILLTDADREAMGRAIDSFGERLKTQRGIGLFFYAGHGIQVKGSNYLIPVRSGIKSESDVRYRSINAGEILGKMEGAGNPTNLVFLDACRNNPFPHSFRSASRGLAQMSAPTGSLVAYSTAPGSVASDGKGRNGVFTAHLLAEMPKHGVSISSMLMNVRKGVLNDTNKQQTPWDSSSLTGDFFFAPSAVAVPSVVSLPSAPSTGGLSFDDLAQEQENHQQWATWQTNMQRDFGKAAAFADASVQVKAWEKFLAGYAQDNPLSAEDDQLRQQATTRKAAAQQKVIELAQAQTTILPYTPPRNTGTRVAGEEQVFDGISFVWIPKGSFMMGSPTSEKGRDSDEQQHRVTIRKGFWLGKYEVSNAEFRRFRSEHDSGDYEGIDLNGNLQPVVNISWDDVQAFLAWLKQKTGRQYRLPSESEWEYAARSGSTTKYSFGDNEKDLCQYGNGADRDAKAKWSNWSVVDCSDGYQATAPVGSFLANAFGLHDMHGNVWEWAQDCWNGSSRGAPKDGSAWLSGDCERRVLRGGSWLNIPEDLRAAPRNRYLTVNRYDFVGFRVVYSPSSVQD